MYRVLPASRQLASSSSRGVVRVTRRRLVTEPAQPVALPKKKRSVVRRIFWATATLTGTFYVGSTFAAFYNQTYYDFFSDHVPLGQSMLEYAEKHNWDTLTVTDVVEGGTNAVVSTKRYITDTINGTSTPTVTVESAKQAAENKAREAKAAAQKVLSESKARIDKATAEAKTNVSKASEKVTEKVSQQVNQVKEVAQKAEAAVKQQAPQVSDDVQELIRKAEAALAGSTPSERDTVKLPTAPTAATTTTDDHIYNTPLPVGFEPPPGYSRPAPPKKDAPSSSQATIFAPTATLPLLSPAVSSLASTEPTITHLAGTIDNLASYLASNPAAASQASDVLEMAKTDLTALADRIEQAKQQERDELTAKLDEQTREYTIKLLEYEMEAQDKLDSQEDDFRKFFDEERAKIIHAYRAKLDNELKTQTELINERLKEEVIAQGIELQRRWIREIKVRVEQERGGRLAKIDELSAGLKRLERIALDNSTYLDENIRVHALWSAVRTLTSSALSSPVRKPFREELRVLRHINAAREDPVVAATLESLESTDVPDVGVEPFADLATWFSSEVAPKVAHVALVPDENAGVLSYLASRVLSEFRFSRQGLVGGNDVLSVVARAEHFLNEKDLDSAARELNQLKGAVKVLLKDWLEAARRRLEVEQALEVVQTQATLASLLVV